MATMFQTNSFPTTANPFGGGSASPNRRAASPPRAVGYFWRGADGNVYVQGDKGINSAGKWDANTANYWAGKGFVQTRDSENTANENNNVSAFGAGGAKTLDTAQLSSLDSFINSLGLIKDQLIKKAAIKRDTSLQDKATEKANEESKYSGKKLTNLQGLAGAKTDTDLNTTSTLENLISSLSTLGLGGGRALARQILGAANMSNRKANATQATNNQALDTAWNQYVAGNEDDIRKINDQFGYDEGEANRQYLQNKQNALYKKADVYNAVDDTTARTNLMNEANSLNTPIAQAPFMNPSYVGESKAMAAPDLGTYTQNIAKYDTTGVGGGVGAGVPGNLAIKAIAVNDKDLGIKTKPESQLGYGL